MSKSFQNKKLFALFVLGFFLLCGKAWSAGPVNRITFSGLVGTDVFTAGVSTNGVTNDFFINTWNRVVVGTVTTDTAPDAGQSVTLELVDIVGATESVIENGLTPTVIPTLGVASPSGGILNGGSIFFAMRFFRAGTVKIRATTPDGNTWESSNFTVSVASKTKLIVLAPGTNGTDMSLAPGTNPSLTTGISGTASVKEPFQNFTVRVIMTDNQFNQDTTATDMVTLSATGLETNLVTFTPTTQALTGGQADFTVTLDGAGITRTITASATGISNGDLSVNTNAPKAQEVIPFPSPFNPKTGTITFRYRVTAIEEVTIMVLDTFGQKVWERSTTSAQIGINDNITWNGRNGKGEIVSAGIYYAIFKSGSDIKSKRPFGVIK